MSKIQLSTKAKTIIQGSVIGIACIGLGIGCGYLIKTYTTPAAIDYDNMNIAPYLPDEDSIMKKYEERKESKSFSDLSASELMNISFELFRRQEYSVTYCIGNAVASIVNQGIRSCLIRNNKNYFEENLSKSTFVSVANRTYGELGPYKRYLGSAESAEVGKYNASDFHVLSREEMKATYGKDLDEIFIYVISDKTILNSNINLNNGAYTIDVDLDPSYSVYYYVRQMKNISNLKTYPTFSKVHLTLTADENLNIQKMDVKENYYALTSAGVGSAIEGKMTFTYYNKVLDIPELNTPINYKEAL